MDDGLEEYVSGLRADHWTRRELPEVIDYELEREVLVEALQPLYAAACEAALLAQGLVDVLVVPDPGDLRAQKANELIRKANEQCQRTAAECAVIYKALRVSDARIGTAAMVADMAVATADAVMYVANALRYSRGLPASVGLGARIADLGAKL